jgi:hypothetical protein
VGHSVRPCGPVSRRQHRSRLHAHMAAQPRARLSAALPSLPATSATRNAKPGCTRDTSSNAHCIRDIGPPFPSCSSGHRQCLCCHDQFFVRRGECRVAAWVPVLISMWKRAAQRCRQTARKMLCGVREVPVVGATLNAVGCSKHGSVRWCCVRVSAASRSSVSGICARLALRRSELLLSCVS